uniref:Apple domain-containing protein n=1 Tax=Tetranychus urticae TaxID=32264 RepID=T1L4K9_TETUR
MLLSTILLLLNFSFISTFSLVDLKPEIDKDTNLLIYAKLRDPETGKVWNMEEKISSNDTLKGKIDITSSDGQMSVFYSFGTYDNNKRLVMYDNQCYEYIHGSDWKTYLPGVTSKFINQILLIGPSVFYRLSGLHWLAGQDAVIRGIKMHSATADLARVNEITFYYKTQLDPSSGVKQPSRILLAIPNDKKEIESFILDLYFISQTTRQLGELIQPTPGIGCPNYMNKKGIEFPLPSDSSFHLIFEETINESKRFLKEIHVDETIETLRSSEIANGSTHNYVYDYNLGVSYHSEPFNKSSSCSIRPIELTDPGIGADGKFSVSELLWLKGSYEYLGDVYYEHRSNFKTSVWESVDYNKALPSGKYDKVVTTQYLAKVIIDNESVGYNTVGATRNAYKKDPSGKFILVDSIRRNFYDFGTDLDESAYHEAFQISDCFPNADQRLTLTFVLTCEEANLDIESCVKASEDMVYELRQYLADKIVKTYQISFLRIADIVFVFTKDSIKADVTFLDVPSLKDSFKYTLRKIDMKSIKSSTTTDTAENGEECLKYHSSSYQSPRILVYCESSKVCIRTEEVKTDSDGILCRVYEFPMKNLYRFGSDVSLKNLHDSVISSLSHRSFSIRRKSASRNLSYKIVDIIETNEAKDEQSKRLFNEIQSSKKLTEMDGLYAVSIPEVASFSDCYRSCAGSEVIPCEIFTFCQNGNEKQCTVTNMTDSQIASYLTTDENCKTFAKSHLSDYSIKRNRKFKKKTTTSFDFDLERCATNCFNSEDCLSFEYSHGQCSFGGYFSEETTQYASDSDIYTPKASRKYELTGSMVVYEVLNTELELDIDQCAALCDDWESTGGQACKSFNFCPKGIKKSACELTAYSVKNQQTLTNKSDICHNYEIKVQHLHEEDSKHPESLEFKAAGVNFNESFGYAFLLTIVGLFVGFSIPCLVIKVKSSMRNGSSRWTKQVEMVNCDDITF